MVRVIPVHNFLGQNVAQLEEEPTAACIAHVGEDEALLIALSSHCVEVRDLDAANVEPRTVFPTVDKVESMRHCVQGNYVLALESKTCRGSLVGRFVRVYVNWGSKANRGRAIRARIAGRVTPSPNPPSDSLEMIELPLDGLDAAPAAVACCQATGNLFVAGGPRILLYEYKVETLNPTKLRFIDFRAAADRGSLTLGFTPERVDAVEDVIAACDARRLLVFRLAAGGSPQPDQAPDPEEVPETTDGPVDWDRLAARGAPTVELPGVLAERGVGAPLEANPDEAVASVEPGGRYSVEHLVRMGAALGEAFSCSLLEPLDPEAVGCVACTGRVGYAFRIGRGARGPELRPRVYPLTASARRVALEPTALHALTEAGLESYAARLGPPGLEAGPDEPPEGPPFLIGLRPFPGVRELACSGRHLVLVAAGEAHWAIHALALPGPSDVRRDMLRAAECHRAAEPATYGRLLAEALALGPSGPGDECPALLADHLLGSRSAADWRRAARCYRRAGLPAARVLAREGVVHAPGPGRAALVAELLAGLDAASGPEAEAEADALFQSHDVPAVLDRDAPDRRALPEAVLASPVLREHAADKLIEILRGRVASSTTDDAGLVERFSLALLLAETGASGPAAELLEALPDHGLERVLMRHWKLLFDWTPVSRGYRGGPGFSELAGCLMRRPRRGLFAKVLARLVTTRLLAARIAVRVFLGYLPSRLGRDGLDAAGALQLFLEAYLGERCRSSGSPEDPDDAEAEREAFRILVRSYLGKLAQGRLREEEEDPRELGHDPEEPYLFASRRPKFLDRLASQRGVHIRPELLKLQALLASGRLPAESLRDVDRFLEEQDPGGDLALRILYRLDPAAGTRILIDDCPRALLEYAQYKYTRAAEWKMLIEMLQGKITWTGGDKEHGKVYGEIMKETLVYLVQILPLKRFRSFLPRENEAIFQKYSEVCSQAMHADHVRSMIMETGHQLLTTLNF
ncbi:uncharacterized protein LOC105700871 [Orussus abietinus]|uniref:uncharacterized protein LOC105700871 n=1 Tax=Orussus abietinus TaxID=222816 RepID=UPI0006267A21|nr:uncharacterized protein LOC105700871 [Orussus abietinus]XP_023290110.1 uncharacterized protein LOC105700871 [Orussus abietinus]XP_023290111.1 uncharacterized protein LOC105700871 [Orussus abietinus]XP_023290112.1 uncharacterized protein LOC105700871 [Orussus abietinus]XP_023290113.1 uncharacterized protein LOC105700871 [Orussus abietinus]